MNLKDEINFVEMKIKRLVNTVSELVKKSTDLRLKIEKEETECAKNVNQYNSIELEMKKDADDLENDSTNQEIDRQLIESEETKNRLKSSLDEVNSSIGKMETTNKIETNRIKCLERRIEALERKANSLGYTKREMIQKMRKSTINSPD